MFIGISHSSYSICTGDSAQFILYGAIISGYIIYFQVVVGRFKPVDYILQAIS